MCNCAATEVWKVIPDWTDYEVSDHGNVRSTKFGSRYELKPQANRHRNNYLHFSVHAPGLGRKTIRVHVIVAELFHGPRPDGLDIRHLDGDSQNNHASNLRYGTRLENTEDQFRHGTRGYEVKPYCRNGHDYTPENTSYHSDGKRYCKACSHARYAANAEENARKAREKRAAKRAAA